jgi:biotin carboxyl carrier protein
VSPSTMVHGEELRVPERVILAPALGVFEPTAPDGTTASETEGDGGGVTLTEGQLVTEGQVVGVVKVSGTALPVRSAFTGFLMGMLAHPGERVREGQPVAWLRVV